MLADPLQGYVVRSEAEGWLQGFVTVTNFTTWQRYFAWDSLVHEAGVLDDAEDDHKPRCDITGETAAPVIAAPGLPPPASGGYRHSRAVRVDRGAGARASGVGTSGTCLHLPAAVLPRLTLTTADPRQGLSWLAVVPALALTRAR